jgi:tRNA nucleotidyltransferase (CCA-adding enzyme)
METSPPPGQRSSNLSRSQSEAEEHLRNLVTREPLATLCSALAPAEIFIVGGTVRDAFLADADTDLDLATNLSADEIKARCQKIPDARVVETGIQHGTVLVVINRAHIEITTFRQPSERQSHTQAIDVKSDLSGRDFTINALAFDTSCGNLLDPLSGISDLQNNLLRAVGDPLARFIEDPLRVLRMVRFGDAQGRVIDSSTLAAAHSVAPKLAHISVERIRTELDKIVLSPFPDDGVRRLLSLGALPYTIPELLPAVGFEQNRFHIHDVFEHTMWVLKRAPADRILRWAAIFHDVGKPHTLSVDESGNRHFYLHELHSEKQSRVRLEALKFSHKDTQAITTIVRHHMRPLDCGPAGVRRLLRDLGPELAHWRQFKEADAPPTVPEQEFRQSAARFDALLATERQRAAGPSYGKLAVSGDDLKALGLKAGKELGQLLKELEELVIEDPTLNTRSKLLAEARKRLSLNSRS